MYIGWGQIIVIAAILFLLFGNVSSFTDGSIQKHVRSMRLSVSEVIKGLTEDNIKPLDKSTGDDSTGGNKSSPKK